MARPTRETTLDLIGSKENMEEELKTLMDALQSVIKFFSIID